MKYLDAKRKLTFMMAVLRYLKICLKDDTIISEDDLSTLVIKALPIIFKDYIVTSEDINEVIGGIQSLLVKFENSKNESITEAIVNMETIIRETIEVKEFLQLDDAVTIIKSIATALGFSDKILSDENMIVNNVATSLIKTENIPVNSYDDLKMLFLEATSISLNSLISNGSRLLIASDISSTIVRIKEQIETASALDIELTQLKSVPIEIDDAVFTDELLDIINAIVSSIETDDKVNTSEMADIAASKVGSIEIDTTSNSIADFRLMSLLTDLIKVNDLISTINPFELVSLYSDLIRVQDTILTNQHVKIDNIPVQALSIDSKSESSDFVDIFISHFLSLPIEISTKLNIYDKLKMNIAVANSNITINNDTQVQDVAKLEAGNIKLFGISHNIDIKDYFTIKRVRYSLLKDIDPLDMDDVRGLTMSDIIYKEF